MDRDSFRRLALLRLKEAKLLLDNSHYDGAYYLCGFAVECALKACLARRTKRFDFPPDAATIRRYYYTHDFEDLLRRIGDPLERELKNRSSWVTVEEWSEDNRRYSTGTTQKLARGLYHAVAHRRDGILKCIRKYW